jgi:hypothetical protein
MPVAKMIRCQICGVAMRKNRMDAHIEKVHINPGGPIVTPQNRQGGGTQIARPKTPRPPAPKPPKPGVP